MLRTYGVVEYGQDLKLLKRPLPVPKGEEVLVRTTYAGMCHSDLHIWEGYFKLGGGKKLPLPYSRPFTLGHEIEGVVVAAGGGVPEGAFRKGKSYAIYPWIGCDRSESCVQCRSEKTNHWCQSKHSKGFTDGKSIYGGYSSHCIVPHYKYLIDYEGAVPKGLGCIYMCSGLTAFSALKSVVSKVENIGVGSKDVMIVGLGGLGFQALGFAKALLGGMPLVADIDDDKLEEARARGCRAYNSKDLARATQRIKADSYDGTGICAVVDFVGSSATQTLAEAVLRKGGKSVIVGLFGGMMERPLVMWPFRARSVEGSFVGSYADAKEMMSVLRRTRVEPPPHHFRSISRASESLRDLKKGKVMGRCIFKHDWPGGASM